MLAQLTLSKTLTCLLSSFRTLSKALTCLFSRSLIANIIPDVSCLNKRRDGVSSWSMPHLFHSTKRRQSPLLLTFHLRTGSSSIHTSQEAPRWVLSTPHSNDFGGHHGFVSLTCLVAHCLLDSILPVLLLIKLNRITKLVSLSLFSHLFK